MGAKNLVEVFEESAQRCKDKTCFRFVEDGEWRAVDWQTVRTKVQNIAGGLRHIGLKKGDRVCILSKTRYEWTMADLAILAAGCVVVPIYESSTAEQVKYIIEDSQARLIFVENKAQFKKVVSVYKDLHQLTQIIYFENPESTSSQEGVYSLDELMILGSEKGASVYHDSLKTITPDTDASFVYTSGTTGNPKGAVLTHDNFIREVDACFKVFVFEPHYETLVFLPFAHILARVVQFFHVRAGFVQCYAESVDRLIDNIKDVKPHFMVSVPRIFEKIHARTLQSVEGGSSNKKKIFYWALDVGQQYSRLLLNKQKVPLWLALKQRIAHKLVFSQLHNKLGGRIVFFVSGGAPLSTEVASFFKAFGVDVLEGYGLTETTAAVSVNRFNEMKFGTVGKPIEGAEFKIAGDGEILVRGKMVFKGYYKNQQATDEAIDADGWFHTGDIGEFDEEGFLKITDRKKDIIVTAAGKNVAPQNIENIMKLDPYISQFVVHGDKRKFLSALVTLDREEIIKYASHHHIPFKQYEDLVNNEKIYELIKTRIEEKNKQLARYETIKKFAILPMDFSIESGELTPTLKVKRKVVCKKYGTLLDGFYV
ncbi:MAG: long-chain fatty acid--CoA ligase [Deltaproteobacteria bacterium]|nr:long-chain fatty acid--CoA ligase [Deltaproteobacteria bacterium]